MESILEKYEKDLASGDLRHVVLARIFCEAFDRKIDQKVMGMFGKLAKMYPKKLILLAILDMYDMESVDFSNNWYGLLTWFIKKRLDEKTVIRQEINLNERAERIKREIKK